MAMSVNIFTQIHSLLQASAEDYDPACMKLRELHISLQSLDVDLARQLGEAIAMLEKSGHPYSDAVTLCEKHSSVNA
jgi:hypothetical protein